MPEHEDIEKVRQEIMRFRELLNIMAQSLNSGERAYEKLFANCSDEDKANLKEKELQWKVAEQIIDDLSPLRDAVLRMRFSARTLEKEFEQLHDIIMTEPTSE
jgi:Mg2+ and Co2+ transporter CorA